MWVHRRIIIKINVGLSILKGDIGIYQKARVKRCVCVCVLVCACVSQVGSLSGGWKSPEKGPWCLQCRSVFSLWCCGSENILFCTNGRHMLSIIYFPSHYPLLFNWKFDLLYQAFNQWALFVNFTLKGRLISIQISFKSFKWGFQCKWNCGEFRICHNMPLDIMVIFVIVLKAYKCPLSSQQAPWYHLTFSESICIRGLEYCLVPR